MTARLHTKIATTIAAVALIAAATATASAGPSQGARVQIPPNLSKLREPGSTGYVPMMTPAWLKNFREPGSTGYVPKRTRVDESMAGSYPQLRSSQGFSFKAPTYYLPSSEPVTAASRGFAWQDAGIGAAFVVGLGVLGMGAVLAVRRRHGAAHA